MGGKVRHTLTFVELVAQVVGFGLVLGELRDQDGGQVPIPGGETQIPEELLHRVEGRDGLVQVVHGEGDFPARGHRHRHPGAVVLHGGRGGNKSQKIALCSLHESKSLVGKTMNY